MTDLVYRRLTGVQALAILDDIVSLYSEIHSENPGEQYELFSEENFISRTSGQAKRAGFELVTATLDTLLVGFSFGLPFPSGVWWADCTPAPQEILSSSKFAVIELDVRKEYRGQGVGKKLLDILLDDRSERFATLASETGSPAYAMYIRWGWYKVGTFEDLPPMDAMIIPLR